MPENTSNSSQTILITLAGRDRPGITSLVFATLADHGVELLDLEQILIRGRLVLGALVTAPLDEDALRAQLSTAANELSMSLEFEHGPVSQPSLPVGRSYVTVLGSPLRAQAMA
ncbi:MAG TPA: ACT domain-containing protein, partial [Marmoricola sp.]|nr:ACT domain-containing protein [Marmoricola sp.]